MGTQWVRLVKRVAIRQVRSELAAYLWRIGPALRTSDCDAPVVPDSPAGHRLTAHVSSVATDGVR